MNQTPAALLVLAASVMASAAQSASATSNNQTVILTLAAMVVGAWGIVSLLAANLREREALVDSHTRLDLLDRVMVSEPIRTLKEVARSTSRVIPQRPLEISPEMQSRINALARLEGRDRSEILEETLRHHLPDYDQRVA
ncbi:MAG: ribbon-helix-helix protein, CopG family [Planctomycetales bacterium]|nr:ribbon-helix-helix protein, CopG family [Planctomycetales bacterium]MCA9170994.1 ribbon-helix-helix protein, CopG family [Planctomycetales bacterium]